MKIMGFFLVCLILTSKTVLAATLYDCNSPRPEMPGFHNMVLFGAPNDQLYAYHLPLFAGQANGTSGHVLMHVYQGLWNVRLDAATKSAYDLKFLNEKKPTNPFPFFTIGPKGNRFMVPEMICNANFSLTAQTVYGHVEGNPDFPQPEKLANQLSKVTVQGRPLFARRFDGSAKSNLTYFLFGTSQQQYMMHFLTDDENSFDQIVAVEILDADLKNTVTKNGGTLVAVPSTTENGLVSIADHSAQTSANNKWKLPTSPLGKTVSVKDLSTSATGRIKIMGEVYFNNNDDLKR